MSSIIHKADTKFLFLLSDGLTRHQTTSHSNDSFFPSRVEEASDALDIAIGSRVLEVNGMPVESSNLTEVSQRSVYSIVVFS